MFWPMHVLEVDVQFEAWSHTHKSNISSDTKHADWKWQVQSCSFNTDCTDGITKEIVETERERNKNETECVCVMGGKIFERNEGALR